MTDIPFTDDDGAPVGVRGRDAVIREAGSADTPLDVTR